MFNFVQNWLAPAARPIGVDFGTDCLRMAQVQFYDGAPRLIAAASVNVPLRLRGDLPGRAKFFAGAARELLASGNFRGRQILLGLPAALASIASISVSTVEDGKAAIAATIAQRMGLEPEAAIVREFVVCEIDTKEGSSRDIVLVAASRAEVNRLIGAVAEAQLEIIGMSVEPTALIDCFSHVYLRRSDAASTSCYMDIGASATRMTVARAGKMVGAETISIGGDDFARAVAWAASVSYEEAGLQRLKICHCDTQLEEHRDKRVLHVVRSDQNWADVERQRKAVDRAIGDLIRSLVGQFEQFREQFAEWSPENPIDRLIFVGGEAHNRALCRSIAQAADLSAIVGDPLLRMGRISDIGFESGIDRREPQPGWAVAIGLSLGPKIFPGNDQAREVSKPPRVQRFFQPTETRR